MFTIYSKESCPQCTMAENILKAKGQEYITLKLGVDYTKEKLLEMAPGAKTVPQIFRDNELIGGVSDLNKFLSAT